MRMPRQATALNTLSGGDPPAAVNQGVQIIAALGAPVENRRGLSLSGGGDGGTPPPECYPNGTECRGWIQNMVYCCPGGTTWKRREGWCVGWYDALPCPGAWSGYIDRAE
jgi:hypothetical protein